MFLSTLPKCQIINVYMNIAQVFTFLNKIQQKWATWKFNLITCIHYLNNYQLQIE